MTTALNWTTDELLREIKFQHWEELPKAVQLLITKIEEESYKLERVTDLMGHLSNSFSFIDDMLPSTPDMLDLCMNDVSHYEMWRKDHARAYKETKGKIEEIMDVLNEGE